MNDLNELNQVLFQTLKDVKEDRIDANKAKSIVDVSNAIINNGKLQLSAYRLANQENLPEQFALPQVNSSKKQVEIAAGEDPESKAIIENAVEIRRTEKNNASDQKRSSVLEKRTSPISYDNISEFAKGLGYGSLKEAQDEIGALSFQNKYNTWKQNQLT